MISLTLPFPPSANAYIRHAGHRHYFSKQAAKFRADVAEIMAAERIKPLTGRLSVSVRLFAPTKRRYDIDNRIKALLDAMEGCCYADDEAIDSIDVVRGPVQKGGAVKVVILSDGAA